MTNAPAPQADEIEIPARALVACPLVGFDMRPVADCSRCKLFAGLEDRFPGGSVAFHKRYLLKCLGEPARRQMHSLTA